MISQGGKNILVRFVAAAKDLLMSNVTAMLQQHYGIWKDDGRTIAITALPSQDTETVHTAKMLRERLRHIKSTLPEATSNKDKTAVEQLIAEQAFTILNRFCALRMCEERELILPSVGNGFASSGFAAYDYIAQQLQLPQYERYKMYIQSVFDELSIELPSVFDRFSPYGLIFPDEQTLLQLFELLNSDDLKAWFDEQSNVTVNFWKEDETLGWIFQNYNSLEERRAMRKASAKPRNSREMAVRNQFFTPEYIVRFLTDNSLGRIWYEMTGGKSRIADEQCHYMVIRPDEELTPRDIKEPTEIRTLDPTCGSMHFGIYVYEVYEYIYLDAWDNNPELLRDLRAVNSRDSFRKLIPSLILEHNIYGCEIDPRALQLAALSLWLRAQRTYSELGILPAERPLIQRSNLVLAEAMPGNRRFLNGLLEGLDPAMQRLIRKVWEKMKYAGEAGLLFKMEQEIESEIEYLRQNWAQVNQYRYATLFSTDEEKARIAAENATRKALKKNKEGFFNEVTIRLQEALQRLSSQLSEEEGYENTLFADDATRGFAFIELCQKRFDCIVMNPPFGDGSVNTSNYLDNHYPAWCGNLVCAFFDRMRDMLNERGKLGAIFDRGILFRDSYTNFRHTIIDYITCCADTGDKVLDASVSTSTFIIDKKSRDMMSCFIDIQDFSPLQKGYELLKLVEKTNNLINSNNIYICNPHLFASTPDSAICYNFGEYLPKLFSNNTLHKRNIITREGFTFVAPVQKRLFYENVNRNSHYKHVYGGSNFTLFYTLYREVVQWIDNGKYVKTWRSYRSSSLDWQCKKGVCYGKRGDIVDAHVLKSNMFFTAEGLAMPNVSGFNEFIPLSYINSIVAEFAINQYTGGDHKISGKMNQLPMPDYETRQSNIREIVNAIIEIKRWFFSLDETNLEYHGLLAQFDTLQTISLALDHLQQDLASRNMEYLELVKRNDNLWMDLAGIAEDSDFRKTLNDYKSRRSYEELLSIDNASSKNMIDRSVMAQEIVQELVGMAFGRWNIAYAQGKKPVPEFGDVFDALPFMPEVSLKERPANYPVNIPEDGILSNDVNSHLCLATRVREVIHLIWGDERADDIEYELCGLIGCNSLQAYFENPNGFFAYHFKRYTKSHRKAPIYWPVSSSEGDITYWVYYPKLSHNTLPALVLKLRREQEVERNAINAALAAHDRVAENNHRERLLQIEDMMRRLEDLNNCGYKPNHDDGVPVTAAPLAAFFHLRAWRQECEQNLEKLNQGEYDWSHLAMSLHPARVTAKCKKDWCLALTHGLEAICENKPAERRSRRRSAPEATQTNIDFND